MSLKSEIQDKKVDQKSTKFNNYQEPHSDDEDYYSKMYVYDSELDTQIEEIRQRIRDGKTGVITENVTRSIGDRHYSCSREIFEDGHSRSKEQWINIPNDDMLLFKKEWTQLKKRLCPGVNHDDLIDLKHDNMPIPLQ